MLDEGEGKISCFVKARNSRTLRSQRPVACVDAIRRNSGDPKVNQCPVPALVRQEKAYCRQSCMHGLGKSDDSIVPVKRLNNGVEPLAESVEGRGSVKGNAGDDRPRSGLCAGYACRAVLLACGSICLLCANYLRQEPDAVIPHVRICAGGARQRAFLPRRAPRSCRIVGGESPLYERICDSSYPPSHGPAAGNCRG